MVRQKLNPKIFSKFKKRFPDKTENAIYVKLSKLSRKHNVTLNAAAEIWAKSEKFGVWGLLGDLDRESLKNKSFQTISIKKGASKSIKNEEEFVNYLSQNKFLKAHITEINKCYNYGAPTACYILIRKVLENLVVEVIKKKFPDRTKEEKEIYLNLEKGRIHDLSDLIKNLREKSKKFDPDEKKLIQRFLQLSEEFKDDANDKTHSLYHISSKKELKEKNPQFIFDLIKEFFDKY
jgi:hypothetical protein